MPRGQPKRTAAAAAPAPATLDFTAPKYPSPRNGLLVIVSRSTILPDSDEPQPATIEVDKATGRIRAVLVDELRRKEEYEEEETAVEWILVPEGRVVMPGLVDAHVHLNAPGRSAWEGHQTGTAAAVSGGVTTLIDMPLNSLPPTTTVPNLHAKLRMARFAVEPGDADEPALLSALEAQAEDEERLLDQLRRPRLDSKMGGLWCDLGFWGGLLPDNRDSLTALLDQGVKGFKCFMIESGVDEFPMVTEGDIQAAFDVLKGHPTTLLFHAEMGDLPDVRNHHAGAKSYQRFLDSRPDALEVDAISVVIRQLRRQAKRVPDRAQQVGTHVVHLASADAVPMIRSAREDGLPLTIETTFHYLVASADHVPNTPTPSTEYKCCPPLRSEANRFQLWDALEDGVIDYVVSDHSPCTPSLKDGGDEGFMSAWGGISALGLGLSLLWTETGHRNLLKAKGEIAGSEVGLAHLVRWCATRTAQQVGLLGRKGVIAEGADADLIVFDPNASFKVEKDSLLFKNKLSPFIGRTLKGTVEQTYLRGNLVYTRMQGKPIGPRLGELL